MTFFRHLQNTQIEIASCCQNRTFLSPASVPPAAAPLCRILSFWGVGSGVLGTGVFTDVFTDVFTGVFTDVFTDVFPDVVAGAFTGAFTKCIHWCIHWRIYWCIHWRIHWCIQWRFSKYFVRCKSKDACKFSKKYPRSFKSGFGTAEL